MAKLGDDRPSDLGDLAAKNKKEINDSGKTEWPAASIADRRPRLTLKFVHRKKSLCTDESRRGKVNRSDFRLKTFLEYCQLRK